MKPANINKMVVPLSHSAATKLARNRKRPDLAGRLKLRDGNHVIAARVMDDILDDNKGPR